MRRWHTLLALACTGFFIWLSSTSTSSASSPMPLEDELLRDATLVFQRAVDMSAAAIPASILSTTRAIVVIPAAMRDGHMHYGRGVLSARGPDNTSWTPPAIIAFEGSIPLNLETGIVDFVLVAQTPRGLERLTRERFTSPVIVPILAGPLGQGTAETEADLLAYIQFGDYFAGVTVADWMIAEMTSSNMQLYGKPYSTAELTRGRASFPLPPAARLWHDALADYFRGMS